jgi:PRA1 family protein
MSLHALDAPTLRILTGRHYQPLLYPSFSKSTSYSEESMGVPVAPGGSYDPAYSKGATGPAIHVDIETMRIQLSSLVARLQSRISMDTIRPLPIFLGLNPGFCLSVSAFTPPIRKVDKSTFEKIKSRVQLNFAYFISNYALIAIMTALVVALMHPGMVLFVGLVFLLWRAHEFLIRNPLILFGLEVHSLLTIKQRFYFLFTISAFVVIWKCLKPTLIFISIATIMILSHAVLRDPKDVEAFAAGDRYNNVESDDEDLEEGGTSGGDSNDSSSSAVLVERTSLTTPGTEKRRTVAGSKNSSS